MREPPRDSPAGVSRTGHYCPSCHAPVDPADHDCPECGLKIPQSDPLIGYVFDGKYRVVDRIGYGGMAVIYWADDLSSREPRDVALKLLKPDLLQDARAVERFRREATRASEIQHVHAVRVFEHGEFSDGLLFMAMERLKGTPLRELIRQGRGMSEARAVKLMAQIAAAVGEAHRIGLVHRDLKPDNVMVEPGEPGQTERAVVLDFGIAKPVRGEDEGRPKRPGRWFQRPPDPTTDASGLPALTRDGYVMGTPDYMSPEQAAGRPIDPRSDVFSLGLMMFEMLAGELPWEPLGDAVTLAASQPEGARRLRTLGEVRSELTFSPDVERVVQMALAPDPAWRYPHAAALMEELDGLRRASLKRAFKERTTGTASVARPTARVTWDVGGRLPRAPRRGRPSTLRRLVSKLAFAIGGALVLGAVAVAAWVATSDDGRTRAAAELARFGLAPAAPGGTEARSGGSGAKHAGAVPTQRVDPQKTAAQLLSDGERALEAHRWSEAAADFDAAMDRDRPSVRALVGLAKAQAALGQPEDSQNAYLRAMDLLNGSKEKGAAQRLAEIRQTATESNRIDALPESARRLVALGDSAGAASAYQDYLDARPWDGAVELRLGALLARANRLTESIPHLESAAALTPENAEAHLELGQAYLRVRQTADAERELGKALSLDPDLPEARRQLDIARAQAHG